MGIVVQKYGGSSLRDAEAIARVARRVVETKRSGRQVVVVVSAMGDTTDELVALARSVTELAPPRELDRLLSCGELISTSLMAMALSAMGFQAESFSGRQAGITTDTAHTRARIVDIKPDRIRQALAADRIPVVAGYQGMCGDDVTTLGRGGSDTTAVALAAALDAEVCEIYTDVAGVYTADPRVVESARKLDWICYDDMLEMAANGCRVLLHSSVEYARALRVPVHVRSSFTDEVGTWVGPPATVGDRADVVQERSLVAGIADDTSLAHLTVSGVPSVAGDEVNTILRALATAEIEVESLRRTPSDERAEEVDVSLTLAKDDGPRAMEVLGLVRSVVGFRSLRYDDRIGRVTLVGNAVRGNPVAHASFFDALTNVGADVEMATTSKYAISAVCRADKVPQAMRELHRIFGLDRADAVVVQRQSVDQAAQSP